MKVLHIVRQFKPSIGGLEDVVMNLAIEQSRQQDVHIYTLNTNFQNGDTLSLYTEIGKLKITRFKWFGSKRYPVSFIKLSLLRDFDVINVHAVDFFADYISFLKRLGLIRAKIVITTHGGFFHTKKFLILKKVFFQTITRFNLAKYSSVICCSEPDYTKFSSVLSNCKLIENGVAFQKFGLIDYKSIERKKQIIYFGRFSENKRIKKLLNFFMINSVHFSGFKLVIVGRSSTGDTSFFDDYSGLDNISFKTDVSDTEILSIVSESMYTISASEYEGFGLGVVELMSYGLVPILSNLPPSFTRFVKESSSGFIFDLTSESAMQLGVWLNNSDYAIQSSSAVEYASKFSWKSKADEYRALYE